MPYIFTIGNIQPLKSNYSPIAIGDIGTVTMEEWAEHWRNHGSGWRDPRPENVTYLKRAYGGSDMSIISDTSNFTPKISLWADKCGIERKIKRKGNEDALEIGHMYETVTAEKYAAIMRKQGKKHLKVFVEGKIINEDGSWAKDKNGKYIENRFSMYMFRDGRKNKDGSFLYPWALANCDAFVTDEGIRGGLEIKTTSARNFDVINKEWKEGIIPKYYLYQIVYYMGILNLQFWDICCSWGQSYDDTAIIRFYRDYDLEEQVFHMVEEFDEFVEQGIEPSTDNSRGDLLNDYYYEMFGPVDESVPFVELSENFRGTVNQAIQLTDEIKDLQERLKAKELEMEKVYSKLYPVLGNSSYAQFRLDDKKVAGITLKTPMKRACLDQTRLEADHPEILKKYLRFDSTAFGKAEPKLKKQYMLPAEPDTESKDKHPSFTLKILDRPISA